RRARVRGRARARPRHRGRALFYAQRAAHRAETARDRGRGRGADLGLQRSRRGPLGDSVPEPDVCKDIVAIISRRRLHPGTDETIDALLITTLGPLNPRFLLNVEFDDFGVLENRDCGCAVARLGLDQHVSRVRSFAKLTAEGTAITSAYVASIIEEALPRRFGGASVDYQLVEEDRGSTTRLTIVVSRRVGDIADGDI